MVDTGSIWNVFVPEKSPITSSEAANAVTVGGDGVPGTNSTVADGDIDNEYPIAFSDVTANCTLVFDGPRHDREHVS